MMAHKILTLFLILSSCTSLSNCSCIAVESDELPNKYGSGRMSPYFKPDKLICSWIHLTKESQLNEEYNSSNPTVKTLKTLHVSASNILKLYDNTFDGFRHLEQAIISNSALLSIEHNTFLNWDKLKLLNLSYNGLTSIDFYLPPNIMYLNIAHNKISHLNFKELQTYDKLKELNFSNNLIISIENFGPFDALNMLDLSHNNLFILANITRKNNQILDFLILSHNNIRFIPQNIETIIVKHLDLSYNNISAFNYTNVKESINLSHNKLTEFYNFSITINNIDFSNNEIQTHINEDTFKNLNHLKYLNLSRNHIKTIYPGAFHDLINLENLDLSDNIISELPKGLFHQLANLKLLYIANNSIEQFEHGVFTDLNGLLVLNISNNKIDNLDAIYSLENLKELNIIDNYLYQLDVDQIIKHLSALSKIHFNIPGLSCEELMVYFLKFETEYVTVEKGNVKYQDNVNGLNCHSNPKIEKQEKDEHRLEYIANYLSGISAALIVILVVLVFVIISSVFTLYQVCIKHSKQTEIDRNLQSCSTKLLSENDSVN